jgi:hypothetical protein
LIALIANARRSAEPPFVNRTIDQDPATHNENPAQFDSAVYGPSPLCKARDGVGLLKRPVLLQTHPGAKAVKPKAHD